MLRTKSEQKAYLDGYEMCAECIENYLSDEDKIKLKCLLSAVRNAVEIEDITENDDVLDKIRNEITMLPLFNRQNVIEVIDKHRIESENA